MKRVCAVCLKEYAPDLEKGPAALIYCSGRCAWDSTPRDRASMQREADALRKMLKEKPS